jgi:hypothetical protein
MVFYISKTKLKTMKKLVCMIALGAISFGTVMAAVPVGHTTTAAADTMKKKIKKKGPNGEKSKVKVKKDTTKMN